MRETATQSTAPAAAEPINAARLAAQDKRSQAPALLNERQAAEFIGVSVRKFHALRSEPFWPMAIELGPRCLRWSRDELLAGLAQSAPRRGVQAEPAHLAQGRAKRAKEPA